MMIEKKQEEMRDQFKQVQRYRMQIMGFLRLAKQMSRMPAVGETNRSYFDLEKYSDFRI